jgi:hypothetical protein
MATLYATDYGHQDIMDVYFRGATAPSAFAMRLVHDTVVGTDNWADISANELPSANGYTTGGATINRDATANGWPTLALDSSEMQVVGKECSWLASGNWATSCTAVTIVADKATDQLVLYANITACQPLVGETVAWTPKYKLSKS